MASTHRSRVGAACRTFALFVSIAGLGALAFAKAIPEPTGSRYPGTITLTVDATDVERKIYRVRESIPVKPGPLTLLFPQWLPGTHSPTGNIVGLTGLEFTAGGKSIAWERDTVNVFAFHLTIPAGATTLDAGFQFLLATTATQGRVLVTPDILNVQWNSVALYPAGYASHGIVFEPAVTLPEGWQFATALEKVEANANSVRFKPVSLTDLVDSPLYAGRYLKRWDISPDKDAPVFLNVVADNAESLAADAKHIAAHRGMVEQSYKVFGRPPYTHYEFLIAVSENYGGTGGLEHRQSTEIGTGAGYFTKWNTNAFQRPVVPHEFAHVWNGKYRRPADLATRNYNEPMQNTLLWVYEGQTSYWGNVLAARSGLLNPQEALDALAGTAAEIDLRAGRDWRNLQDTTNDPIMGYRGSRGWPSWQRGADYYPEGVLLWLDTDIKLRELTAGRKSLDDFARAFFAVAPGQFETRPYNFDELIKTLNGVAAFDWSTFLRARLDSVRKDNPLDPLGRSGWKLVFTDKPNTYSEAAAKNRNNADFRYSLGFNVGRNDQIGEVEWGSPAFNAKVAPGSTLVAVNGRAYKQEWLNLAITAAKNDGGKIELLLKLDDRYRTVVIDYRGGLRYPHLERVEGTPDRLAAVFAALK